MKSFVWMALLACMPAMCTIAQTLNHPVIEKVKAMYKSVPVSPGDPLPASSIMVRASVLVTLKNEENASKIFLNMKDKENLTSFYQVSYTIASPEIKEQGIVLYQKTGLVLSVVNPAVLSLRPYIYELYTEDAAGHKSALYTITQ